MHRLLLYSPDVIGHPRVYCRVIADVLQGADCEIFIAMGFSEEAGLSESSDLHPLISRNNVSILDNREYSKSKKPHLTAEELVKLQSRYEIDTTLFIEADKSNNEFKRIANGEAPTLHGRNLGIFANTSEWYPGENSFTGERLRIKASTLRTTLGNIKRAIFNRKETSRYFFEKILIRNSILDEIFVKDERLATWHGEPIYWMPEITRPVETNGSAEESDNYQKIKADLDDFLSMNSEREPMLYFGDAAFYKGYDIFLKYISSNPSVCAIHPGRSYDTQQYSYFEYDVEELRKQLKKEGRLYETNAYVDSQRLKELYFGSIKIYLTTHRLALSSSTVIQALELGKPVLVPDRGILGYRVKGNKLGDVYEYGNIADLSSKASKLLSQDFSGYTTATKLYWQRYSDKSIRKFFTERLLLK